MHGLFHALTDKCADERVVSYVESHDQALAFWRGGLVFVFNFSASNSYSDYPVLVLSGSYRRILDTD